MVNVPTQKDESGDEEHFTAYCISSSKEIYTNDTLNKKIEDGEIDTLKPCNNWKSHQMVEYNGNKLIICKNCFIVNNRIFEKFFSTNQPLFI